jgi:hypothetical protein
MAKRRVKVTQLSKAHRSPAATAPGLAVAAAPAAAAAGPMAAPSDRGSAMQADTDTVAASAVPTLVGFYVVATEECGSQMLARLT